MGAGLTPVSCKLRRVRHKIMHSIPKIFEVRTAEHTYGKLITRVRAAV
jgi:hypothetical protein